jgi:hypothetical protein
MTESEAVAALDALVDDPNASHIKADDILCAVVPKAVADAYHRAADRVTFWYA